MTTTTARRCLRMLVLSLLLTFGVATTAFAASSDTTVKGVVRGHGWHFTVRLVGAKVTVVGSSPLQQAITRAHGRYRLLASISTPPYVSGGAPIRATARLYRGHTRWVRPKPGGTRICKYSLVVKRTHLSGRVFDRSGHPISWARVRVAGHKDVTSGRGFFKLTCLRLKPGKSYTVKFRKPGYRTRRVRFMSAPGGSRFVVAFLRRA
jgi:Carboxypeptidase regulatory-like domain